MDEVNKKRLTPEREAEIRQRIEDATQEVIGLANGSRKWRMCVPPQSTDSDELLCGVADDASELLDEIKVLREERARLRADADQFRDLIRTLLDMPENAAPIVNWCEQHGEDISTFLPGGAWWEHDPAEMLPKLDAGEIQEALAMYVLNVDRMEVRRMLEAWRAGKETA